jgi:superfamily I DNA/RNA helicase
LSFSSSLGERNRLISERLRLLYVGITRARRSLHLSRTTRTYNKERDAEPATVLAVLYHYLKEKRG